MKNKEKIKKRASSFVFCLIIFVWLFFTHMIDYLIFIARETFTDDVCSFFFFHIIVVCTEIRVICVIHAFILNSQPYTEAKQALRVVQILIYILKILFGICVRGLFLHHSAVVSFLQHLIRYFVIVFIIGFYFIASVLFLRNFSVTSIMIWM